VTRRQWSGSGIARLTDSIAPPSTALLDRVITEAREQENTRFEGWSHVYRARVCWWAPGSAEFRTG